MRTIVIFLSLMAQCLLILAGSADLSAWKKWAPREEIAPKFSMDKAAGRSGNSGLRIESESASEFGAWRRQIQPIHPGSAYRFTAYYRAKNVPYERRSIIGRLEWLDKKGQQVRPPEYAIDVAREGNWTKLQLFTQAPTNAVAADIQLSLGFAANAVVTWDDIQMVEESSTPDRTVRAVTLYHRPRGTKNAAESVEQFCSLAMKSTANKPDIICMPEGITVVGTGKTYAEVSEAVPGPTTQRLGALGRELKSYVVAGLYERVGPIIYNTAVLINRDGNLVGKYRKTHLPREEWEAGITPGDEYPIFETDFGKVGLMICWDLQFPEPARAMALKGAELILLPIWGGSDILAQARAIENHIFLVSSTYDMRSFVIDPAGKILAEATQSEPVAMAELHLDRKIYQPWLGDMKNRTWKERRPDIHF